MRLSKKLCKDWHECTFPLRLTVQNENDLYSGIDCSYLEDLLLLFINATTEKRTDQDYADLTGVVRIMVESTNSVLWWLALRILSSNVAFELWVKQYLILANDQGNDLKMDPTSRFIPLHQSCWFRWYSLCWAWRNSYWLRKALGPYRISLENGQNAREIIGYYLCAVISSTIDLFGSSTTAI